MVFDASLYDEIKIQDIGTVKKIPQHKGIWLSVDLYNECLGLYTDISASMERQMLGSLSILSYYMSW